MDATKPAGDSRLQILWREYRIDIAVWLCVGLLGILVAAAIWGVPWHVIRPRRAEELPVALDVSATESKPRGPPLPTEPVASPLDPTLGQTEKPENPLEWTPPDVERPPDSIRLPPEGPAGGTPNLPTVGPAGEQGGSLGQLGSLGPGTAGGLVGRPGGEPGSFRAMVGQLRWIGLEICFVFDSTGSMGPVIAAVQAQIGRLIGIIVELVPRAQFAVATYRDEGDEYVVRALPLTRDAAAVQSFVDGVSAGGGGDEREAVLAALRAATGENGWKPRARKVVLLFGDAPPHEEDMNAIQGVVRGFGRGNGVVSTISTHPAPIPEFGQIAEWGGGEAHTLAGEEAIVRELLVLAFGSQWREHLEELYRGGGRGR